MPGAEKKVDPKRNWTLNEDKVTRLIQRVLKPALADQTYWDMER